MSAPVVAFFGPLFGSLIVYLLQRRWPRAAAVAGFAVATLLTFVLATVELQQEAASLIESLRTGEQNILLGRTWFLSGGMRQILLVVYATSAVLFLLAVRWPQGPNFVPAGLSSLAPLALAIMVNPLTFGIAALLPSAVLLAAVIEDKRPDAAVPAWRFLLFSALALPVFLMAGWMLESQQLAFGNSAWRFLFLGIILILGAFPFHIWVRAAFSRARPLAGLFVLGPAQLAILTYVFRWLEQYPQLLVSTPLSSFLGWSGAATVLIAGVMALNEDSPRGLLGSLVLADMGAVLICLSAGSVGIEQAWALIVLRIVGLILSLGGLLWAGRSSDGAAHRTLAEHPPAAVLFAIGALSLIGLPLTPGFTTRWAAIGLAGEASIWWAIVQLMAIGACTAGLFRALAPVRDQIMMHPRALLSEVSQTQRRVSTTIIAILLVLLLALTLYPWPILDLISGLHAQF